MPNGSEPEWESYADWYRRGTYAPFVAEARLPADVPVQLLRVRQPAGDFPDPATPDLSLALLIRGFDNARLDFGAGRFSSPGRRGEFALAPDGAACDYRIDSPHEFLLLTLPATLARPVLQEASRGRLPDHGPMHALMNRDAVIESLVRRLWVEAADGDAMGPLLAEDVAVAVAARLARMAVRASGMPDMAEDTPPLHGARLVRVLQRIKDQLEAGLSQADLAAEAGLSPWHFARAFKAATGVAPHRFVLLRRLARAQWMLRATKLTLAEVAAACGFSSHAHLTTLFRREVGTTPGSWRGQSRAP